MSVPVAVTIAGSDSSGGAGVQADMKTFAAFGVYGACAITAVTAQNSKGVTAVYDVPRAMVAAQIDAVFSDLRVGAVKIGMLSHADVIETVAAALERWRVANIVLDPVLIASTGARLLEPAAIDVLRRVLVPRASVMTPNLAEAAALLDCPPAVNEVEMQAQAERLLGLGARAVLLKGGHGKGPESVDLLVDASATIRFAADRVETKNTHGSGCTLSAAIAAGLARGLDLPEAVREAKAYVTAAIAAADRLDLGVAYGPLHHFYRWW